MQRRILSPLGLSGIGHRGAGRLAGHPRAAGGHLPAPLPAEMGEPRPKSGYALGSIVQETDCGATVFTHDGGFPGWAALTYGTPGGGST